MAAGAPIPGGGADVVPTGAGIDAPGNCIGCATRAEPDSRTAVRLVVTRAIKVAVGMRVTISGDFVAKIGGRRSMLAKQVKSRPARPASKR